VVTYNVGTTIDIQKPYATSYPLYNTRFVSKIFMSDTISHYTVDHAGVYQQLSLKETTTDVLPQIDLVFAPHCELIEQLHNATACSAATCNGNH